MTIYLISYDLNKPNQDYQELFGAIEKFPNKIHVLKSAWFISTTQDAQGVYDVLRPHIDDNDHLFVSIVNSDKQGWIPKKVWEWLRNN